MKYYIKDGKINPNVIQLDGDTIINPTEEHYIAAGFQEYKFPTVNIKPTIKYEELVEKKIRQKYSVSDEIAILRQSEVKQDEYNDYYNFCEHCKMEAKKELNL